MLNKTIITIHTGEKVNIDVTTHGLDEVAAHPENLSCLTCGTRFEKGNLVEVKNVFCIEGSKDWLDERNHHLDSEDNFVLCSSCADEFYSDMEI